jgi:hypothetical protein
VLGSDEAVKRSNGCWLNLKGADRDRAEAAFAIVFPMCGRYRRTTAEEEIARQFHIPIPPQPISPRVNSPKNDDPGILEPI